MNETERLLAQARKDCPDCHGTGIIEGAIHYVLPDVPDGPWQRDADRVCLCVPLLIIHAPDAEPPS